MPSAKASKCKYMGKPKGVSHAVVHTKNKGWVTLCGSTTENFDPAQHDEPPSTICYLCKQRIIKD